MSAAKHTPGWVSVATRLPEQYREVRVKLVDGYERVARLNVANCWQIAGFKADAHKYQYQGDVGEWFDERDPLIAAAPDMLLALQVLRTARNLVEADRLRIAAAIAKATGSQS